MLWRGPDDLKNENSPTEPSPKLPARPGKVGYLAGPLRPTRERGAMYPPAARSAHPWMNGLRRNGGGWARRPTTRNPALLFRLSGVLLFRSAARQFLALLFQPPPRNTRAAPTPRPFRGKPPGTWTGANRRNRRAGHARSSYAPNAGRRQGRSRRARIFA